MARIAMVGNFRRWRNCMSWRISWRMALLAVAATASVTATFAPTEASAGGRGRAVGAVLNTTTAAADCRPTGTMPAAIPSSATVPGHAGAAPSFIRPWGRSRAGCGSAGEACCISARATARIIRSVCSGWGTSTHIHPIMHICQYDRSESNQETDKYTVILGRWRDAPCRSQRHLSDMPMRTGASWRPWRATS